MNAPSGNEIQTALLDIEALLEKKKHSGVLRSLRPILDSKCPFPKLERFGKLIGQLGKQDLESTYSVFDAIVADNTMGGYVVVGKGLVELLDDDFDRVMEKSREYIIAGSTWYVCDIIGERSLGQALVHHFDETLPWLKKFLRDENKWVKRSTGVAIHLFSKRIKNDPAKTNRVLSLIEPSIEEKQIDIVKGIGWGLKTIGKHHPDLLLSFLNLQLKQKKKISPLMMRKAQTYLNKSQRAKIHA